MKRIFVRTQNVKGFIGLVENDIIPPSEYLRSLNNDHLEVPYILFSGM